MLDDNKKDAVNGEEQTRPITQPNIQPQSGADSSVQPSTTVPSITNSIQQKRNENQSAPHIEKEPLPDYNDYTKGLSPNHGILDIVKQYHTPSREEELALAKRQRNAAMLSDLGKVLSQGLALGIGTRKLQPLQYSAPNAEEQIQKIRQLQAEDKRADQEKEVNARMRDAQQDIVDKANAAAAYRDEVKSVKGRNAAADRTNAELDSKAIGYRNQEEKNKNDANFKKQQLAQTAKRDTQTHADRVAEIGARLKAAMISAASKGNNNSATNPDGTPKPKKWYSINVNEGGKTGHWIYPDYAKGMVAGLYEKMKAKNPNEVKSIEDMQVNMGVSPANARESVVQQLLQNHPELTSQFTNIPGVTRAGKSNSQPSNTGTKSAQPKEVHFTPINSFKSRK